MIPLNDLTRLTAKIEPSRDASLRIRASIERRIQPSSLSTLTRTISPSSDLRSTLKSRVFGSIQSPTVSFLQDLCHHIVPQSTHVRASILSRCSTFQESVGLRWTKWAAACAAFVLIVRTLPLFLLAPVTNAATTVDLLPTGPVTIITDDGVETEVSTATTLTNAVTLRTGPSSSAVIIMNGDGIIRLQESSEVHIDVPLETDDSTTSDIALHSGHLWALGYAPSFTPGLSLETSAGTIGLHGGSIDVRVFDGKTDFSVYDRGALFTSHQHEFVLVTNDRIVGDQYSFVFKRIPPRAFTTPWVLQNLAQDASHRDDIAARLATRREELAGILPTSFLYPAKRFAEEVDVLLTLTRDGKTEKRLQQASVRLNEALEVLKEGQPDDANVPLEEYRSTLVALAADHDDNLVKSVLRQQIADASTGIVEYGATGSLDLLRKAVADVQSALPQSDLQAKDIEGYILVDTLADINQRLRSKKDVRDIASAYAEIRPYLQNLLSPTAGVHPLLQKEARSLLVSSSNLAEQQATAHDPVLHAFLKDINPYIPEDQGAILVSEEELHDRVQVMYDRIFVFRHPRSRYNQLLTEMAALQHDPHRGTLLRRLKVALPDGLSEYVNTEIQKLGDELRRS